MSYAFELLQVTNDSAIKELSISASRIGCVELDLRFENYLNKAMISYKIKDDDTLIEVTKYNKRLVEDKNYIDVVCEDLFNILSDAKFAEDFKLKTFFDCRYEEMRVEAVKRVYEQFKIYLQTTKSAINVHSLHLQIDNVSQLRSVLKYFNPTKLKDLKIFNFEPFERIFDFGSIVEMDHWKNVKKILFRDFFVNISFENFRHCEDVTVKVKRISADDIQTLVNICSNSPSSRHFHIDYGCLNEHVTEQFLDKLYGEQQINKSGKLVRLIENKIEFVHESFRKSIFIYKISDKNDVSMETSKALTSQPSKSVMLCLSNKLIMEKIVQHFDFAELVVLRRVSSGSRHCVDLLKPDPKLVAIKFCREPGCIFVDFCDRNNSTTILYKAPGTDMPATSSYFHIKHKADINNLSDDLVELLKDQKTALKEICVFLDPLREWDSEDWKLCEEQFVDIFKKTYLLRGSVFPAEKLNLTTACLKQAPRILQYMDPRSIKRIELQAKTVNDVIFLNDLASLEQWTNAVELKINDFIVECDLAKLVHFAKIEIILKSISSEGALYLKEKFLLSSNFRQFKAKLYTTDVYESIFEDNFLGAPFRRVEDISSGLPDIWFFQYTDSMENLQIRYYRKAKEFMFKRVPRR